MPTGKRKLDLRGDQPVEANECFGLSRRQGYLVKKHCDVDGDDKQRHCQDGAAWRHVSKGYHFVRLGRADSGSNPLLEQLDYREQPETTLSTVAETLEFSSEEVRQKRQSFSNCAGCVAMINIFVSHACGSHQ